MMTRRASVVLRSAYERLDARERFALAIAALARGDDADVLAIRESSPRSTYTSIDAGYMRRVEDGVLFVTVVDADIRERSWRVRAFRTHRIALEAGVRAVLLTFEEAARWALDAVGTSPELASEVLASAIFTPEERDEAVTLRADDLAARERLACVGLAALLDALAVFGQERGLDVEALWLGLRGETETLEAARELLDVVELDRSTRAYKHAREAALAGLASLWTHDATERQAVA